MLAADLITATRRHLNGSWRGELNRLDGDLTLSATTVTFAEALGGVTAKSVISVGLEDMYVWSVDAEAKTADVQRGYGGSVVSAHSDQDLVEVNARFTAFELFGHVNTDLTDLCAPQNGLYQIRTLDLTAVSGREGYDFPAVGFLSVADVRWPAIDNVSKQFYGLDVTVRDGMPTTTFPSGTALFVNGVPPLPGQTVTVRYRAVFDPLTSLDDDVEATTGLPSSALDLPALGAAIIAMAGRPVGRAQYTTQGDTRRAGEVSVGEVLNSAAALRQQRANRIVSEANRLAQQWPTTARRIAL